jgi:hypothetical protein
MQNPEFNYAYHHVHLTRSSGFPVKTGLEDCTAEAPKDGSATIFKAEARRTPRKEFLIKKFSDLCELGASVVNSSS